LISLIAYLPHWAKILRGRSSGAISSRSWAAWSLSSLLAVFCAVIQLQVTGRGWALVFSTVLGLGFVLFTLILVVRYRVTQR